MTTDETILAALKDFGLTDPEIAVYLAMLELGSQPASIIAKKARLKRGHTYNILTILIQKGLVQEFLKKDIKHFSGVPPKTLLSLLDHRQEKIEMQKQKLLQILPDLQKIQNPLLLQPKVKFFQGVAGLQEMYEDTIRISDKNILAVGDFDFIFAEERHKELHDWIWNYADRRAKKNIWYLGIVTKSEKSDQAQRKRKVQKRKLKMLNEVYLPVEINIYENKVALMSTYQDMVGVIIEDAPIAETLRNFHQAVWRFLPDYE